MPIPAATPPSTNVEKVVVDLNTMTGFNTNRFSKVHTLDGWWDTLALDAPMAATGYRGAVRTGLWTEKERYLTVGGYLLDVDPQFMRRALVNAFPLNTPSPITVTYPDGTAEQLWVEPYDRFTLTPIGRQLRFTLPLVALDPLKYGMAVLAGDVGVSTRARWYRGYEQQAAEWVRTYDAAAGWSRSYIRNVPETLYPKLLTLESGGDARSDRVVAEVSGPLTIGDWWLESSSEAGTRTFTVYVSLTENQTLVIDSHARTATVNGADVADEVFGDWPALQPGLNAFRLVSGTTSEAYAHIEAQEALT